MRSLLEEKHTILLIRTRHIRHGVVPEASMYLCPDVNQAEKKWHNHKEAARNITIYQGSATSGHEEAACLCVRKNMKEEGWVGVGNKKLQGF